MAGKKNKRNADGLRFDVNSDEANICGYDGNADFVSIPETYKGLPVRHIYDGVFKNCSKLRAVHLPDTLYTIGRKAFKGSSIENLAIPGSVYSIAEDALDAPDLENIEVDEESECFCSVDGILFDKSMSRLIRYPPKKHGDSYTVPPTVGCVCKRSFYGSKVSTVSLPPSVKVVEDKAFMSSYLKRITMPAVERLGKKSFFATYIRRITIPRTMTEIGECALLTGCLEYIKVNKKNKHFISVDGILYSADQTVLIQAPNTFRRPGSIKYSIPDTVTTISRGAMYDCAIESIDIPESVKTIGAQAFQYSFIRSITLPPSVEYIGKCAFYGVSQLEAVRIKSEWPLIEDHAFDSIYLDVAWVSSKAKLGKKVFRKSCEVIRW